MDKYRKIRKWLGYDYYLSVGVEPNKPDKWALYKYYNYNDHDIVICSINKPIMTSEKHTYKQLYNFAKKTHMINIPLLNCKTRLGIVAIALILATINLFIGNTIYSYKKGKLNAIFTDSDAYSNGLIASIGNDFYVFGVNSSYRRYKVFSFYSVNVASQLEAINADISSIKSSVSTINNQIGGLSFSILDGDLVVTYNEGMEGNE